MQLCPLGNGTNTCTHHQLFKKGWLSINWNVLWDFCQSFGYLLSISLFWPKLSLFAFIFPTVMNLNYLDYVCDLSFYYTRYAPKHQKLLYKKHLYLQYIWEVAVGTLLILYFILYPPIHQLLSPLFSAPLFLSKILLNLVHSFLRQLYQINLRIIN